ncbi:MAG: sorbosone dehydrogenase family protein [Halobacteriaceae archaeon]
MTDDSPRRRDVLRALAASTAALAGCSGTDRQTDTTTADTTTTDGGATTTTGGPTPTTTDAVPASLGATGVASGFASPVGLESPPGDDRLYVVDQPGVVAVVDGDGRRRDPFLDVRDRVVDVAGGYSEMGLLGLAFHPDYRENGRVFLRYSAPPREDAPRGYDHTFVLAEFSADPDAATADPDSERAVMLLPEPQSNHNSGAVAFGPDGYCYVGTGDGGAANDQGVGHVEDWYGAVGGGNGQDVTENLLGSVLRVDVDENADVDAADGRAYGIPGDNPLVGREGRDEHWAWGLRNPWRMSFGPSGRLYVADVGQNRYEEVDVVERGGNYGWNVREGTHCFQADRCPAETPDGAPLVDPVVEYAHDDAPVSGVAVVGGHLYDGGDVPGLRGRYVFADWRANGRLFVATPRAERPWPVQAVPVEGTFGSYVLAFGYDGDALYACTNESAAVGGGTGAVYRVTA